MPAKLNIAVLASGKGSNLRAILDAIRNGTIQNAEVVLVISNNADAGALAVGREYGIPALHLSRGQCTTDEEFSGRFIEEFRARQVGLVVLAGYMKKIDAKIVRTFRNRMINIHPALLPAFGGTGMFGIHVHEAVLAAKSAVSGASVHLVDEEYDHGRVLLQETVPVLPDDTPDTLAARVLLIEHKLYPEAIRQIAGGLLPLSTDQSRSRAIG